MPHKPKGWTPAEQRALQEIEDAGHTVRTGQLVALAIGLWSLFRADWGQVGFCLGAIFVLQLFLPMMGPEWQDRANELDNEE